MAAAANGRGVGVISCDEGGNDEGRAVGAVFAVAEGVDVSLSANELAAFG